MKRGVRSIPNEPPEDSGPGVFFTPEALAINEARLCHLASLGLNLAGKTVLEVGSGVGLLTCFWESLGCSVTLTDARPDNVAEARRRSPHRKVAVLDLDSESDLSRLGMFDIIFCYGTLYHLSRPKEALMALARICREAILLETCVTPGAEVELCPEPEPPHVANQASSGLGCRPTRPWVMRQLKEYFGYAYNTRTQPAHGDFEPNWLQPARRKLYRAVFVGSKRPVSAPVLSEAICDLQNEVPDQTNGVWLDIGARAGETAFEHARRNPELTVYAFEPNLSLAAQRFGLLSNYIVVPVAVGDRDGLTQLFVNKNSSCSSVLPSDAERLGRWIGGGDLESSPEITVPTTRLDTFLNAAGIAGADYLNIAGQGADFSIVMSAGQRLADIRKIKLAVAPTPPDKEPESKDHVVSGLAKHGFALVAEQPQMFGEENLVFFKVGTAPSDLAPRKTAGTSESSAGFDPGVKARSLPGRRQRIESFVERESLKLKNAGQKRGYKTVREKAALELLRLVRRWTPPS